MLAGVAFIALGQWLWFEHQGSAAPGVWAVVPGIILVIAAARSDDFQAESRSPFSENTETRPRLTWKLPFAGVGLALVVYTGWRALAEDNTVWDLLLLWGCALWLTVYGLVPTGAARRWRRAVGRSLRDETSTWLAVGGLFALGLVVRFAWLETQPYIMAGDDAAFAIQSVNLKDTLHWVTNPFKYGVWHHPLLYHTMVAAAIDVLGQTVAASRIVSALLGALTIPAIYLMGRRIIDHRVGLVAAIFLVGFPFHVQFSRTGMNMVGDPLFAALAFAFLTRALRDNDAMEAALAGLALGLSQYFYFAAKLVPLLVVAYVGMVCLRDWRRVRTRAGVLAITAIVAGAVVFPNLYSVFMDKERPISPRLAQVSVWETGAAKMARQNGQVGEFWGNQIRRGVMAFVQVLDESDVYGKYNPVLGWFGGVPFIAGLALAIRRWRDPRFSILALWVLGTGLMGGALLIDPPHYPRYVSATPALGLLVGMGIVAIGDAICAAAHIPGAAGRLNGRWVTVGLALALVTAELGAYVFDNLPRKLVYGETTVQLNEVADILDTLEGRYQVWTFSSIYLDLRGTDLIDYLSPDNAGQEFPGEIALWREVIPPEGGEHAFVIAPARFEEVGEALVTALPGGEMRRYDNRRTGAPLVYVYFVTGTQERGEE
jgi:4-amino-4-deoxy-L-arabinose transferase-like glycosyltransferase